MKNFCLVQLFVFVSLAFLPAASNAIDEKLLKEAGLETVWQTAMALNPKEKIQRVTMEGNYIFILTDSNYIFCLERDTGRLNFAFSAATFGMPVLEPTVYNNTAYIVAANYLIAVDLVQGMEIYRDKIPFPVSAAIAANASYLYIPATDKHLYVTRVKDIHPIFKVTADNVSGITNVLAADNRIFFATDAGNVICMEADSPKRIWQFDTVGAITAPLVAANGRLYISCKDTNLYQLRLDDGTPIWPFPFHSGSILTASARATENVVYQYAPNKGLYAIDAQSGKQIWLLADGLGLLAQDGDKAYVFDKNRVCVVMDNRSGGKIYTINFAQVTDFAVNTNDSNIYIMEGKNILCIRPVKK